MKYRWLLAGLGLLAVAPAEGLPQDEGAPPLPLAVKPPAVDLSVKAASVEVAWLSDPATYPYRLRAEHAPGEEAIALTGFLPSEAIHQKAAALARMAAAGIPLKDRIVVLPQMAMTVEQPLDTTHLMALRSLLEKATPTIAKHVQLALDAQGAVTVSGRVDELADRRKIIRALQAVPGCTCVRYDLRMAPSALLTMPSLDVPREETKVTTLVPPVPNKPLVTPIGVASSTPVRQGVLTSKTPSAPVQQADHKPAPTGPVSEKKKNQVADKAKDTTFFVPSASGLTPPSPAVSLGQPVRPYRSSFLGDGYILPAAADSPTQSPGKPPALLKDLPPAPRLPEAPPLPIITLPPTK